MPEPEILDVPPGEAVEHFRAKGHHVGFDWRDTSAALHTRSFTVAKAMRLDILRDIRGAVDEAIAKGETFATFQARLEPLLVKKGWWGRQKIVDPATGKVRTVQLGSLHRLKTIFDTNLRTSYAHGRWQRIQRLKDRMPYLRYVAVHDNRTRDQHRAWHGIVLPVDHPFWETHFPPNGWRCRCTVQQMDKDDLKRFNLKVSPDPKVRTRPWRNRRTGKVEHVPVGIAPGFAHNVGTVDLAADAQKILATKLTGVPVAIRRQLMTDLDSFGVTGRAIWEELLDLVGDINIDSDNFPKNVREALIVKLRKERGAGSVAAAVRPLTDSAADAAAAERVRRAVEVLPAGWIRKANGTKLTVKNLPSGGPQKGRYLAPPERGSIERAISPDQGALISVGDELGTALHEYLHHVQYVMPELDRMFQDLHRRRTRTEPLRVLRGYRRSVVGRKDDYVDNYFGREYAGFPAPALEVITVAHQVLFHPRHGEELLRRLIRDDPEMLDLVLGVLFRYDP